MFLQNVAITKPAYVLAPKRANNEMCVVGGEKMLPAMVEECAIADCDSAPM